MGVDLLKKQERSNYLSQMLIIVKWASKVLEVNPDFTKIDKLVNNLNSLITEEDEFKVSYLFHKI